MRKFSSYGPVSTSMHYYAPREELIQEACTQLLGENPDEGGHYITVWAPRQCGKTWVMIHTNWRLKKHDQFHIMKIDLEHLKMFEDTEEIVSNIAERIIQRLELSDVGPFHSKNFADLFHKDVLDKPLILILDEFDALTEDAISTIPHRERQSGYFDQS